MEGFLEQILEVVAIIIKAFESGSSFWLKEVIRSYVKGKDVIIHVMAQW